ncbi:MAG TPA: response regulator [Candidatus Omnitrophota bacterium]|nr:response regulator [Candidatus Omnitrophota bacterium]
MPMKDFKIVLAISNQPFAKKVIRILNSFYTISLVTSIRDLSSKIHQENPNLIIIDYSFGGMRADEIYRGIEFLHPNVNFIVYTAREKKYLAKKLWKRRAMDYLNYTDDPVLFVQNVNKTVRWTIQRNETVALEKTVDKIEKAILDVKKTIKNWETSFGSSNTRK